MRNVISAFLLCAALVAASDDGFAQAFPNRPIRLIVGYPPGSTDVTARMLANRMSETMGQAIVVENRPGAGSLIGADIVAKAVPDGYTLFYGTTAISTFQVLNKNLPFDPLRDLMPITQLAKGGFVIVAPSNLPVKTLGDFIAYAKQHPKQLNYGSLGKNSVMLMGEAFKQAAGIDMTEVAYRGMGLARTGMLGGEIQFLTDSIAEATPMIKDGRLRALSTTNEFRAAALPDIPSVVEAGLPGFRGHWWIGVFAPAGTPGSIIARLHDEFVKAARTPDVQKYVTAIQGGEMVLNDSDGFRRAISEEIQYWQNVAKLANVQPD